MRYVITADDRIDANASDMSDASSFCTLEEFQAITLSWPLRRFVNIWNKLPDSRAVTRFENRSVGVQRIWRALHPDGRQPVARRGSRRKPRSSKSEAVVALLRRPEGATLKLLMKTTKWQAHTVRGFISRKISKQPGLTLESSLRDGERVYTVREQSPNAVKS